jgi:transcriptional regulator with XRE-family HTH domain
MTTMIVLLSAAKAQEKIARNLQARRLAMGLTQAGLATRSGVALGTLRKFERTGAASVETLLKLLMVVGGLEQVIAASAPEADTFSSIDDVLQAEDKPRRKHGWRS